jgi:pectate lyase
MTYRGCLLGLLLIWSSSILAQAPATQQDTDSQRAVRYIEAVQAHADMLLEHARDVYGQPTPLFVDGLNVQTLEPVRWNYDEHVWTLSNLASQQNLLRTLDGLTALTGRPQYRQAAVDAVRYAFDHLRTPNGLLLWGGHTCYDAAGDQWVGRHFLWPPKQRIPMHELKAYYPYYELMWQVDPQVTRQFIESFWAAHVRDWSILDFDRHGNTRKALTTGEGMWDRSFEGGEVFFEGKGRTFVNAGSDLYYAGAMLYRLGGQRKALEWAYRLAGRYVATRDPKTGLRGYQFSTRDEVDRAFEQFGDLFPDSLVREATIFRPHEMPAPLLVLLRLSQMLGREGAQLGQWAVEDLAAIGRWSYDPAHHVFRTMLLDGTDLSNVPMPRDGYFGSKGWTFGTTGGSKYFLVYAVAARGSRDAFMWEMARQTARDSNLGDIGQIDGAAIDLNMQTSNHGPDLLLGLLELHQMTGRRGYLDLACRIGDNILADRFENGLFTTGPEYIYTRTSRDEPLALLHLAAALQGRPGAAPVFLDGDEYFACEIKSTDKAYSFDRRVIYPQRRP